MHSAAGISLLPAQAVAEGQGGRGCQAAEALRLGLVQFVVESEQLEQTVADLTGKVTALSESALAIAKRCIATATGSEAADGFNEEISGLKALSQLEDTRSRVMAFLSSRGAARPVGNGG